MSEIITESDSRIANAGDRSPSGRVYAMGNPSAVMSRSGMRDRMVEQRTRDGLSGYSATRFIFCQDA
jgi:hypothetical protein